MGLYTINAYQYTFSLDGGFLAIGKILPAYNFNESVPQNYLTNQKLFFTFSLLLIGRICCSSLFPMAKGDAVGVVERQLVFHFVYYKGYRRNLTVLV
jgi:hypothetical protein